ncbi:ATP-binding protein [Desulfolucanica intricata]|uniref:ATP-binding protein n=1 Tax=Desulfolucanica intricata TaxID=1285191 RepID=UPI0008309154|nr:ATP-binding protein [Desulfolucanica intricata]
MQVVGITTQQEVFIASRKRKFEINEILLIEDPGRENPRGEVVETQSFNRYIPLSTEHNALVDDKVITALKAVGYDIDKEEINLAKVRIIGEISTPVSVGAKVRLPVFSEVSDLLIKVYPEGGLTLGEIRGTAGLFHTLPGEIQNVLSIYEGNKVGTQKAVPFIFDYRAMNEYPHIGIFGGSGSGKSFGLRVVIEEFMKKNVPGIVLDPHYEMDFRDSFPNLPPEHRHNYRNSFALFTVGRDVGVNFEDLDTGALKSLLGANEQLTEAMDNAVGVLHSKKDSYESFSTKIKYMMMVLEGFEPDKLNDFERKIYNQMSKLSGRIAHSSTVRGISWRLNNLFYEGLFGSTTRPIEDSVMRGKIAVLRGPLKLLQVYGAYVFDRLYKKRRDYRDAQQKGEVADWFPPFIIFTDEAHSFVLKGERDTLSKRVIKTIAQEGRKYGVNICLATQRPALLDDTVTAQLNTKIIFRTVRSNDIEVIKEETDLGVEESRRLPYLNSGNAFISSAITGRAIPIRFRCTETVSPHVKNPFDELAEHFKNNADAFWEAVRDLLPISEGGENIFLPLLEKKLARKITRKELFDLMDKYVLEGKVSKEKGPFGFRYVAVSGGSEVTK